MCSVCGSVCSFSLNVQSRYFLYIYIINLLTCNDFAFQNDRMNKNITEKDTRDIIGMIHSLVSYETTHKVYVTA